VEGPGQVAEAVGPFSALDGLHALGEVARDERALELTRRSLGAAGGLGGFVPPLIMGYVYGRTDSYGIGLALLSITAALTLVLTVTIVRRTANQKTRKAHPTSEEAA